VTTALIVVPARGGSKRLPGKNLRPLGGRTLLAWTQRAIAAAAIDAPVLLTTDDDAIAAEGERLGWQVPFRRPAAISDDAAPTAAALLHALDWRRGAGFADPDIVVLLQVTSPFRKGASVGRGFAELAADPAADACVGVRRLPLGSAWLFGTDARGHLARFATGGGAPAEVFAPNGAFFAVRTAAFRAGTTFYPPATRPLVMDEIESIDIDTGDDWELASAVAETLARQDDERSDS
jgi:CMP-N,N'-diacetyllegionaminic acid synthase